MKADFDFTEYILSQFGRNITKNQGIEQLIARYQTLAIMYLNFFFLGVLIVWKIMDLFLGPLPGNEVIIALPPMQIISIIFMRKGRKDKAAFMVLMAIHTGNFLAGNVCNVVLGAAYLVPLLPSLAFFLTSNRKMHYLNLVLCVAQNTGHMLRLSSMFKVTFTEDQYFQIFSLVLVSFMYIPLSYCLFAFQKYIEAHLLQVVQLNYEKAERITKELVEAVESKDKVVSSFSHEIRNPLNSLNGSIDYLLKTVVDPAQKKVLKNARLSGEVLLNLVNNILDAAKLKSEKLEIACVEASPTDVVRKVLTINSEIVQHKNISAKAYIHKSSPQLMYIDSSRLLQVIMNLFSNATKFTQENGKIYMFMQWFKHDTPKERLLSPFNVNYFSHNVTVEDTSILGPSINNSMSEPTSRQGSTWEFEEFEQSKFIKHSRNLSFLENHSKPHFIEDVKSHSAWIAENFNIIDSSAPYSMSNLNKRTSVHTSSRGFLKVQISDSGCGIASNNISKLFNMFSQVETGSSNGGTGLGLWISKQLCQKMGGDIAIYSKANVGTTVVFYIAVDNQLLSSTILSNRNLIEKLRALVVDDYPYNRDVHKLILEREGVEVSLACDGKEAYEKYMAQPEGYFSFIMMDIQMPVMDGITAAMEIRKFEEETNRKQIEIYFVSGNYYSKTEVFSANGNALDLRNIQFLRKPIDVEIIKKISDKYSSLLKKGS